MNREELNTALYEKMAAEQNTFRDWLKSQGAEVVLTTPTNTPFGRTS